MSQSLVEQLRCPPERSGLPRSRKPALMKAEGDLLWPRVPGCHPSIFPIKEWDSTSLTQPPFGLAHPRDSLPEGAVENSPDIAAPKILSLPKIPSPGGATELRR